LTRIAIDPARPVGRLDRKVFGALDLAVDVHVNGPVASPELPAGASRWPSRIGDLGPFGLIDAAATVSASDVSAHKVAVTLVNRSPEEPGTAEMLLRDCAFEGGRPDQDGYRRPFRRRPPAARRGDSTAGRGIGKHEGRGGRRPAATPVVHRH
jgi:hypothetical protein